jgi:hypothetical protein
MSRRQWNDDATGSGAVLTSPARKRWAKLGAIGDSSEFEAKSQSYDSPARRDSERVGSITRAQLLHDLFEVALHRIFRNEQALPDIAIPVSTRDVRQNLDFP